MLKDLVRVLRNETYADPITEFLVKLFVEYDFDGARERLAACDSVLENDFFLVGCKEEFAENARLFIFETYSASTSASTSPRSRISWAWTRTARSGGS